MCLPELGKKAELLMGDTPPWVCLERRLLSLLRMRRKVCVPVEKEVVAWSQRPSLPLPSTALLGAETHPPPRHVAPGFLGLPPKA